MPINKSAAAKKAWKTKRTPMPEKFWNKVKKDKADKCWDYIGPFQHLGHGTFKMNRKAFSAHRIAWIMIHGPIPPGKLILHKCDNPPCCNPDHLYMGTHVDNGRDASCRKRFPDRKGQKAANSILSNFQARKIRLRYFKGGITQKALGQKYQVSESTIGEIIRGNHFIDV